jgi:hypothetical protein
MGSLLFFLGGKNIVYPLWQSSFVKVSGNQKKYKKWINPALEMDLIPQIFLSDWPIDSHLLSPHRDYPLLTCQDKNFHPGQVVFALKRVLHIWIIQRQEGG